ncbi:immunoglobulin iota chain-like [Solea senegalensis]|nr:immunoglobulin iota chain-like [Solea senegalensis]
MFTTAKPTGLAHGSDVTQTPILWKNKGDNATIHCRHTKGESYYQMYWFRQLPGENMKQILFVYTNSNPDYGAGFSQEKFPATKPDTHSGTLTILAMKLTVFLTLITHMEKQVHLSFLIFLLWTKGLTDGSDVTQTSILWKDMGDNATIHCKHTKGINYYQMYWYRQLPGEMMKQIVFTTTTTTEHKYESGFSKDKFPAQKSDANTGSLTVEKLQPEDSGLYFCSVSQHSDAGDSGSCTKTQLLVTGKRKEDNGLFDRVQMALWI